jgi:hypothetical protein
VLTISPVNASPSKQGPNNSAFFPCRCRQRQQTNLRARPPP